VKKFYPAILALTRNPTEEVRKTAAWVMGQDNTLRDFHRAIVSLLNDTDPLVRRNAALQLVRFGDAAGRPELRAMLQSFEAKSPIAGTIVSLLPQGSPVRSGSLIARIRDASGNVQEFSRAGERDNLRARGRQRGRSTYREPNYRLASPRFSDHHRSPARPQLRGHQRRPAANPTEHTVRRQRRDFSTGSSDGEGNRSALISRHRIYLLPA
jgi:hypothetical protein